MWRNINSGQSNILRKMWIQVCLWVCTIGVQREFGGFLATASTSTPTLTVPCSHGHQGNRITEMDTENHVLSCGTRPGLNSTTTRATIGSMVYAKWKFTIANFFTIENKLFKTSICDFLKYVLNIMTIQVAYTAL